MRKFCRQLILKSSLAPLRTLPPSIYISPTYLPTYLPTCTHIHTHMGIPYLSNFAASISLVFSNREDFCTRLCTTRPYLNLHLLLFFFSSFFASAMKLKRLDVWCKTTTTTMPFQALDTICVDLVFVRLFIYSAVRRSFPLLLLLLLCLLPSSTKTWNVLS